MRILKLAVFLLVLFLLQTVVLSRLAVFGAHFDPLLVAVILWGLMSGNWEGALAGLFAGIMIDASTANTLLFSLIYAAAGYLSGTIRESVFKDETPVIMVIVFFGGLLTYTAEVTAMAQRDLAVQPFIASAVISSLLNLIFVPVIRASFEKIRSDG